MFARTISFFAVGLVLFGTEISFGQNGQRIISKITDLLVIIVPMVFVFTTFFLLEWRRKRNSKSDRLVDLPLNKNKK